MQSEIQELTKRRRALAGGISQFNEDLRERQLTGKVLVAVDDKELEFNFEEGKCSSWPPSYTWAKGWRLVDMKRFCHAHGYGLRIL